jgi:hypothetical protein
MKRAFVLAMLLGCSGANGEHRPHEPNDPPLVDPDPTPRVDDPDPRPPVDPETACGRALACCRAYARAIPSVVEDSVCAGIYEAIERDDADARCGRMARGWREALQRLSEDGTAPAECGE